MTRTAFDLPFSSLSPSLSLYLSLSLVHKLPKSRLWESVKRFCILIRLFINRIDIFRARLFLFQYSCIIRLIKLFPPLYPGDFFAVITAHWHRRLHHASLQSLYRQQQKVIMSKARKASWVRSINAKKADNTNWNLNSRPLYREAIGLPLGLKDDRMIFMERGLCTSFSICE